MQAQVAPKATERQLLERRWNPAKLAARLLNTKNAAASPSSPATARELERYHYTPVCLAGPPLELERCGIDLSRDGANLITAAAGVSFGGDWKGQGREREQFNRKFVLIEETFDTDTWRMEMSRCYDDVGSGN